MCIFLSGGGEVIGHFTTWLREHCFASKGRLVDVEGLKLAVLVVQVRSFRSRSVRAVYALLRAIPMLWLGVPRRGPRHLFAEVFGSSQLPSCPEFCARCG